MGKKSKTTNQVYLLMCEISQTENSRLLSTTNKTSSNQHIPKREGLCVCPCVEQYGIVCQDELLVYNGIQPESFCFCIEDCFIWNELGEC